MPPPFVSTGTKGGAVVYDESVRFDADGDRDTYGHTDAD